MYRTPSRSDMVKTRNTMRKERELQMEDSASQLQDDNQPETSQRTPKMNSVKSEPAHVPVAVATNIGAPLKPPLPKPPLFSLPPASNKSHSTKRSTSSSTLAQRKRLQLEAERKKAEIRMQLIDKELEADLADLEEENYSPHQSEASTRRSIENWMEQSAQELERPQAAPEEGCHTGDLQQPTASAPAAGTSDGTIQMLAAAVKNLTVASVHNKSNANFLSRICTPRDLPEYSGDPLEWLNFKQAYEESTDVCNFSPKENLWRLRKCLRGSAKETVSALLMSAASPDRIMATLELRHGDPEYIINRLVQDIRKIQPLSQEYQKDIVHFSVKVQNFVESVKVVGREEYVQGLSIVPLLISKLPTVLVSKWSDYSYPLIKAGAKSRLSIMSDFLNMEAVKIATTANIHLQGHRPEHNTYKHKPHDNYVRPQAILLQTQQRTDEINNITKCNFCRTSQYHKLPDCKQFKKALRKVRWQYVKRNGICFKCLESRHEREICPAPVCDKDNCGLAHHRLLHYNNNNSLEASAPEPEQSSDPSTSEVVNYVTGSSSKVLLKVVPIKIYGMDGSVIDTSAVLDDGSTVTMISAELAARAGLRGRSESMRVCGPWNNNSLVCDTTVLDLKLSGKDNKVYSITARSVNELCLPEQNLSVIDCSKYQYLNNIRSEICNVVKKPEVLLGQDNYDLMVPLQIVSGKSYEPFASRTPLGWCIHGLVRVSDPMRGASAAGAHAALLVGAAPAADVAAEERALRDLHEEVRRAFELDSLGVSGKPRQNRDDVRAVEHLERTARLVDGRWSVGLPWKDPDCSMPDTMPSALKRLQGVERKMAKDPAYANRYTERVDHLFTNNFARELEDTRRGSRTWYLAHFGVDNPNKNKLRLVFDAADRTEGVCLNDYLLKGPDLLTSLWGIMLRFRENRIAVTGDIKDMFLRIQIQPLDQDALRFLWRTNSSEPAKTYVMTSLIFGAKCSPFIAQFIKNKNAQRFQSTEPAAVDAICNSHYADDYIQSLPDESTAIKMVNSVSKIHADGGFVIRNFTSNSKSVLDSVPNETLDTDAVRFKIDSQFEGQRTLGLLWFPSTDELGFDVSLKRIPDPIVSGLQKPTKRLMLKVVMSIYDVFGFLAPFTVQGKIMLQDVWKANIDWDSLIPDDIFNKWVKWLDLLQLVCCMRIPRWYYRAPLGASETDSAPVVEGSSATQGSTPRISYERWSTSPAAADVSNNANNCNRYNYNNLQLHTLCDASAKAMCAVAYWRWEHDGHIYVAFVASKCKVAPVKFVTVNRLELQAALLAARLADSVLREHKITTAQRYYWSDSTTVLHWIKNDARNYNIYVANRLGEIDQLSCANEWRYIPTRLNVADIATREAYDDTIFRNEWINGPDFLHGDESRWPSDPMNPEINKLNLEYITLVQNKISNSPVPDATRFSSWLRLQRATAAVLKFIAKCRQGSAEIDCAMMDRAERLLIKQSQQETFGDDIAALEKGTVLERSSRLRKLSPFLDAHGILRCSGRIDAAPDVSYETKRPIILDGAHATARLLVMSYHVRNAHGNHEGVVNDLKQKYWLLKLRPTVKYVIFRCMLCRAKKAKPEVPRMGDLPVARLAHHQRPFTHCGLDLFGPMEVTVGRRHELRYGVLFTCLTLRAIHLEIVHSLTSDSLIMSLRRMAARRGWPKYLYSDNGTNLRGSDKELRNSLQELDEEDLKNRGVNYGVQWTFTPPASPHWGGAWERLIRSVKTSLKVILKERAPKDEVLRTLMTEVENMVNGRPLTHVSVDPGSVETLTPNHFLIMGSTSENSNLPPAGSFDDSDLYSRKQWRKSQRLADMFWTRWVKEILPDLIPRTKWTQEQQPLQVGDFVLVVDPAAQRNVWLKGVIQRVFPGKDGRIRVVEVKTRSSTLKRSASRVARIPMSDEC